MPGPEYQTGELNFTVMPEKTRVEEGERFKIHITLTNVGNNVINVWSLHEQISYDIIFSYPDGSEVPYGCLMFQKDPQTDEELQRLPRTDEDIVELRPGGSLNFTDDSRCWILKKGKYVLSAVYHTSRGEHITKPYWLGEVRSNDVSIVVE